MNQLDVSNMKYFKISCCYDVNWNLTSHKYRKEPTGADMKVFEVDVYRKMIELKPEMFKTSRLA